MLRLAGGDVADYPGIGDPFDLWLGSDAGEGVVTAAFSPDRPGSPGDLPLRAGTGSVMPGHELV
jgi:hypothetical protein